MPTLSAFGKKKTEEENDFPASARYDKKPSFVEGVKTLLRMATGKSEHKSIHDEEIPSKHSMYGKKFTLYQR
jgi:hypothetical protein